MVDTAPLNAIQKSIVTRTLNQTMITRKNNPKRRWDTHEFHRSDSGARDVPGISRLIIRGASNRRDSPSTSSRYLP
jgi:hypothetical protein